MNVRNLIVSLGVCAALAAAFAGAEEPPDHGRSLALLIAVNDHAAFARSAYERDDIFTLYEELVDRGFDEMTTIVLEDQAQLAIFNLKPPKAFTERLTCAAIACIVVPFHRIVQTLLTT